MAISAAPLPVAISPVDLWHTADNGNPSDFGGPWYNMPNVELWPPGGGGLAAFGAGTFTAHMVIQGVGFSELQGLSHTGQPVADVSILPTGGWAGGVSLYGFDFGVWLSPPLTRDVCGEVWNGDYSTRLAQGTVNVGRSGAGQLPRCKSRAMPSARRIPSTSPSRRARFPSRKTRTATA